MIRTGLLLRLLLALSLAFNGGSGAMAATVMASAQSAKVAAQASPPAVATPSAHAGCHGQMAAPPAEQASQAPHASEASHAGEAKQSGHGDCCGVGACACACAQLPSLAGFAFFAQAQALPLLRFAITVEATRDSPPILHQTRPPIV